MRNDIRIYVPIEKIDKKKRMVFGYASTQAKDSQGEIVEKDAIRKAWKDYMVFANVREMHQLSAVGKTKEWMHDQKGTWIGVKVVDDRAWKFVLEKVYNGFSIGGQVLRKDGDRIKEMIIQEISLVDRPANSEAVFEMVKRDCNGDFICMQRFAKSDLVESLIKLTVNKTNKIMSDLEKAKKKVEEKPKKKEVPAKSVEPEEKKPTPKKKPTQEQPTKPEVESKKEPEKKPETAPIEGEQTVKPLSEQEIGQEGESTTVAKKKLKKDVAEVSALAEVADNLNYLVMAFESRKRPASVINKMKSALKSIMETIALEAGSSMKKVESFGDLQKVLGAELAKLGEKFDDIVEPLAKVGEIEKTVSSLEGRLTTIEGQPKADRPKTAQTVEKKFDAGKETGVEKKGELTKEQAEENVNEVLKKIDTASNKAKVLIENPDPQKQAEAKEELDDLAVEYSKAKTALSAFAI